MSPSAAPSMELDSHANISRMRYVHEVEGWAMEMLTTLRDVPDGADKSALMRQIDRLKDARRVRLGQLPAYVGGLAILSHKMAGLLRGDAFDRGYRKESVVAMLKSQTIRRLFDSDPTQMTVLAEFLAVDHALPGGPGDKNAKKR
ncbi:MAG: hypothetical protein HQK87_02275 [Nitrospinae bacterium]|nr:hypothetical protein [Nitrospinota bacterium]